MKLVYNQSMKTYDVKAMLALFVRKKKSDIYILKKLGIKTLAI